MKLFANVRSFNFEKKDNCSAAGLILNVVVSTTDRHPPNPISLSLFILSVVTFSNATEFVFISLHKLKQTKKKQLQQI